MSKSPSGLRRAVGFTMLFVACLFLGGFIRGNAARDEYEYRINRTDCFYVDNTARGIGFVRMSTGNGANWHVKVPYLFLIMPPAILSAWLLLSKPKAPAESPSSV